MAVAMDFSFLLVLCIASLVPQAFANCGAPCASPPKTGPIPIPPVIGKPPIPIPPVIPKPPITIPPVIVKPPVTIPPLPPLVKPLPPVTVKPPPSTKPGCPPPPGKKPTCPVDTVKLGACLDVLGAVGAHVGDPTVKCCPLIEGLASMEAAMCLCTTIKLKVLGVKMFLPIATQLFVACGKGPLPPGYTCA